MEFTYFLPDAVQEQAKERLHRAARESEIRRRNNILQQQQQMAGLVQQQQQQQQAANGKRPRLNERDTKGGLMQAQGMAPGQIGRGGPLMTSQQQQQLHHQQQLMQQHQHMQQQQQQLQQSQKKPRGQRKPQFAMDQPQMGQSHMVSSSHLVGSSQHIKDESSSGHRSDLSSLGRQSGPPSMMSHISSTAERRFFDQVHLVFFLFDFNESCFLLQFLCSGQGCPYGHFQGILD